MDTIGVDGASSVGFVGHAPTGVLERFIRACACRSGHCLECDRAQEAARWLLLGIVRKTVGRGAILGEHEWEDLVQDVLLKLSADATRILEQLPQDPREAGAYLAALASNLCRDILKARLRLRRRARGYAMAGHELVQRQPCPVDLDAAVESQLLRAQVERTLQTGRDRFVFRLYYRWGFTAAEIAASAPTLGLTPKGVESLLYRLTTQAREQLNPATPARTRRAEAALGCGASGE